MRFAYVQGSRTRTASVQVHIRAEVQEQGEKRAVWAHADLTPHQARQLAEWLHRSADTALRNALRERGA